MLRRLPPLAALTLSLAACQSSGGGTDRAPGGDAHAERMAREHRHDAPAPSGAVAGVDTSATTGREVAYATLDGRPVRGYLAAPVGAAPAGGRPALVVIHEWWGLNDNVRAMTRRLAAEGYTALAIDLYGGRVAAVSDSAMALMRATTQRQGPLMGTVEQAINYLRREGGAPAVGVVGWCFGGGWSLETALNLSDQVDAAVVYYGRVVTDPARLAALRAPLLGLYGEADRGIPVADVREMERQLDALDKDAEVRVYPGADHAFANPSGGNYDAAAAEDAWRRTTAFLAEHLRGEG